MKDLLLLPALSLLPFCALAQPSDTAGNSKAFTYTETMPSYPGSIPQFLSANLKYPDKAREKNIQGRVLVRFIVTDVGAVDSVTIIKGIGGGCDEEAARVVSLLERWTPGTQNGKAVNVYYTLPIIFVLESKRKIKRRKEREGN